MNPNEQHNKAETWKIEADGETWFIEMDEWDGEGLEIGIEDDGDIDSWQGEYEYDLEEDEP